jgi:peptidoglycan-associated lipoprotein
MKLTKFTTLLVLGLVLTMAASGCRKKPVGVTPLPGARMGKVATEDSTKPLTPVEDPNKVDSTSINEKGGIPSNSADAHAGWPEDRAILAGNTVHFALDSSAVKASEQANVTAVAEYLKSHAGNAVKIEGHCDESGTAEYNRALGERRAQALREELVKLGIDAGRVDTISYGFDQPVDPGHAEASWAKNRRGVFVVLTPPTAAAVAK